MKAMPTLSPAQRRTGLAVALVFLVLAFSSSWLKSVTGDEPAHLGAGMAILAHGDFRMNPEHPPLIKVLAALPVHLFARPDLTYSLGGGRFLGSWLDSYQTEWGFYTIFRAPSRAGRWAESPRPRLALARTVPILIGLLGGYLAFMWARELAHGDARAGLIAAALLLGYTEYLGHARWVTFDVPQATACGAISYAAWRWWRRPGRLTSAMFVLACALGSQVKLPVGFFIVLTLATLMLLAICAPAAIRGHRLRLTIYLSVAALAGCWAACWAAAGFRFSHLPPAAVIDKPSIYVPPFDSTGTWPRWLANLLWHWRLLPEATLATLAHVSGFQGRMMFLWDEMSRTGWYQYFLVTFMVKTPLPMLAGMVLLTGGGLAWLARAAGDAMAGRLRASQRHRLVRAMVLWGPILGLLALTVLSRANLGHRYIMFMYLPLCAALGAAAYRWWRRAGWRRACVALLLAHQAVLLAWWYPHYATYFNVIGGGHPYRGSIIVRDSNADWGQDVGILAAQINRLGYEGVNIGLFGPNHPESWGIQRFHWLMPHYPFAVFMPEARRPNSDWPIAYSLNNRNEPLVLDLLAQRPPDILVNSIMVWLPPYHLEQF